MGKTKQEDGPTQSVPEFLASLNPFAFRNINISKNRNIKIRWGLPQGHSKLNIVPFGGEGEVLHGAKANRLF